MADLTKIDEYADQQKLGSKEKARYIEGIFGTPKVIENYTVHGENSKERDGEEVREGNEGPKSRQYWSKMQEAVVNGDPGSKMASTARENGTAYS